MYKTHPYAQTITHSYTKHGLHFKLFKLHYTKRKENERNGKEVADSIYEIFSEIFHLNGLGAAAAMRCRLFAWHFVYLRNNRITLWLPRWNGNSLHRLVGYNVYR